MQRLASSYRLVVLPVLFSALILGLTSCGGDGGSSNGGSSKNTLVLFLSGTSQKATNVSVNFGDVVAIFAQLQDANGTALTAGTITWATDAPTVASITPNGAQCGDTTTATTCICGGVWQNSNVDCIAPSATATATVTATASTGEKATAKIFVHPRIARIDITTPISADCTSSTGTLQLSAQASDANGNPVTIGNDPTAFTWFSGDSSIASVDTNGLATAVNPGAGNIYVRLLNQTSAPYPFTTCGVKSISAHISGATDTSFTADASTTKTLAADVVDTKGKTITITGARLIWSSNVSGIVTADQTGNATTVGAGRAGIVVSCTPPFCNSGLTSVFSNVVTANVNGTTTSQVLVANSNSTTMIPIDTSTNTAGTAITLPFNPNSLVFANSGTKAFLGSASNLIVYDATATTVTSFSNLPGTVQAVSNNAQYVIVYDSTLGTISNYDANGNGVVDRFTVAGIPNPCKTATFDKCPHASFSADNRTAYIVAGSNLYVSSSGVSLKTIPLGATGNDVAFSAQSSFAFVGNNDSTVVPYASCNNAKVSTSVVTASGVPQRMLSSTDGTAIYAVAPPNLNTIAPTTDGVGCVPSLTDPLTSVDLGQGTFNVGQMLASTKGDRLYFLTGGNNIVLYDAATNAGGAITLTGGANGLSAGLTADGNNLYVGGSDNNVHRIDTTTNTDAAQISVSFTPDLVAVRPK